MDIQEKGSIQLLHDVILRAREPMTLGNRSYAKNEIVVYFKELKMALVNANANLRVARGGNGNEEQVRQDELKSIQLSFTDGTFSPASLGLLLNAKIVTASGEQSLITQYDEVETNSMGVATVTEEPAADIFIYKKSNGERVYNYIVADNKIYFGSSFSFQDIIVNYRYRANNVTDLIWGQRATGINFSIEGRTDFKSAETGTTTNWILFIPKFRLSHSFNFGLGANASPIVLNFSGEAIRDDDYECECLQDQKILNQRIDKE